MHAGKALLSKTKTIKDHIRLKPELRYILFGGKGGVGKTTISAATAYWLAGLSKKVCVFSIDPQASLSDIFERHIFGKGEVEVAPNLYALEIDVDKRVAQYQKEIRKGVKKIYGSKIPREVKEYINGMAADLAITVSATFDKMAELMSSGRHDYYIFDMMPHGHALRFLGLTEALKAWIDKFSKEPTGRGDLAQQIDYVRSRLDIVSGIIKDDRRTASFYVVIPEKIPILDTRRALEKFARLQIPLSGVLVNMIYPPKLLEQPNVPTYLKNRIVMQRKYVEVIKREFGRLICGFVPMFEREPKGLEMIAKVAETLFGK